ncbi:DMT family transporter [Motiliproteus coralliicola]|uniref:DMT family transporter n=1 Tax=Motiliproteus coralliicola TaxID=2283196 RepID=A0A369WSJ1_9GAMM|nr:DMT family transporter [Motiliproteus coralliicola]RDE25070.1 DMT family transporter [Motiliproteus coralliicola]
MQQQAILVVLSGFKSRFEGRVSQSMQGILLALISTALFVVVGVMVRILSERIDLFQILLFRQLVFITLLTPAILRSFDTLKRTSMARFHLLRITGAFLALYLGFVTVSNIPLADATALGFTQVLFVAVISRLFLAESVGTIRMLTLLIGFVGVLLVVQPGFDSPSLIYMMTGLTAALGAAVAVVCVRWLAKTEPRTVLLSYQALFVGLITLVPSWCAWQWPTKNELLLLISVGVISSLAQWIGVTAYQKAEANIVANVEYVKILYSLILGYLLFAELPNVLSVFGVVVLLLSALVPWVWQVVCSFRSSRPKAVFD